MRTRLVDSLASRWSRLGVMLNVNAADQTPDVERLLLDTARSASANSRLFILAAGWVASYGHYIAKRRLARLIHEELEAEYRPVLGLLLEWAQQNGESSGFRFALAIKACGPVDPNPKPLFEIERRNGLFTQLAKKRASILSSKWGRWMADFELKQEAIRPAEWVARHNPSLSIRAMRGGDLLASVLAEYEADPAMIGNEPELARRCAASLPAVRNAIRRLRLAGFIRAATRSRTRGIGQRTRRAG